MKTVVILSYPKSGNTWLRYIIEAVTGRPSLGSPSGLSEDLPIYTRVEGLEVDPDAVPSAVKRHWVRHINEEDRQRPLIVAVRNYKECFIRNRRFLVEDLKIAFEVEVEGRLYMEDLAYYTDYAGPKLLLFYEDLIDEPVNAITSLMRFLEVPDEDCSRFLERYEEHRDRSLGAYPSQTLGKAKIHHARSLSHSERRAWDRQVRGLNPALYDRYLTRYRESD